MFLLSPIFVDQQFFTNDGFPLAGGLVHAYAAGSFTTRQTTFTTSAGDVPNENPIVLDSSGRMPVSMFLTEGSHYNLVLTDPSGEVVLDSIDGVAGIADTNFLNERFSELDDEYLRLDGGTVTGGLGVTGVTQLHGTTVTGNLQVTGSSSSVGAAMGGAKITAVGTPTTGTDAATKGYVDSIIGTQIGSLNMTPVGAIMMWGSTTVPDTWLECNGALISRTTYAALFAVLGTTYGSGNGSTTFQLPDMRGQFPRGYDNGRNIDAGRVIGSSQLDAGQLVVGYLGVDDRVAGALNGAFSMDTAGAYTSGLPAVDTTSSGGDGATYYAKFSNATAPSSRTAAETRPVNVSLLFIIRAT